MNTQDFNYISNLIKDRAGIVLTEDKVYLLETRLGPLARRRGLRDLEHLVGVMRSQREETLLREVTEAMTTNESFFFRDHKIFDTFRDVVLAGLIKNRPQGRKIRIWSAACSSGQEPYSLALVLKENAQILNGSGVEIVASDLSGQMVRRAREGVYSQFEVQRGLPIRLLLKYFKQDGNQWTLDSSVRTMVSFREHNILHDCRALGQFDVVFCRNMLIYFDLETKRRVLEQISAIMPADGVLFLAGTESMLGVTDRFKPYPGIGSQGVFTKVAPN